MDSSRDYYQMSWDVVFREASASSFPWSRIVGLCTLLVVMIASTYTLNQVLGIRSGEFFWLLACFCLLFVVLLGVFWDRLAHEFTGAVVHTYQLAASGLQVDGKTISFTEISPKATEEFVADPEKHLNSVHGVYRLKVPSRRGGLELYFSDIQTGSRAIKALAHYVGKGNQ